LKVRISEEKWLARTNEWKEEQVGIYQQLECEAAVTPAIVGRAGTVREFLQRLSPLHPAWDQSEKPGLLKPDFVDCTLVSGSPCPTYRRLFDLLADGLPHHDWGGGRWSHRTLMVITSATTWEAMKPQSGEESRKYQTPCVLPVSPTRSSLEPVLGSRGRPSEWIERRASSRERRHVDYCT
jgi:hypothetical protein